MVLSEDALRNYALSIAHFGTRHVWADSMDWCWDDGAQSTVTNGAYGEEVLDRLFNIELVYRLTNPADTVSGHAYLYDKAFGEEESSLLFYGTARYTVADLGADKPQYNIWMQEIPLPLVGVESAEVLATDEDGKTARRIQLTVNRNGKVMFQPWLAGAPNGILVVRFEDGKLATYNLWRPSGGLPLGRRETGSYAIQNHHVCRAVEKTATLKIVELWNRPSAFIETEWELNTITVDVVGVVQIDGNAHFERPVSMEIENQAGESTTVGLKQDGPTAVGFSEGKYRVRFQWVNFGEPNMIYTGPTDGGKG